MTPSTRRHLRSALVAALLLGMVLVCRARTGWADWYALHFYPVWSGAMSWLSARLPVSVDEWAVVGACALALVYLVFLKKRWAALVSLLLWFTVWFYAGWGINYFRSSIYDRAGRQPERFEPQRSSRRATSAGSPRRTSLSGTWTRHGWNRRSSSSTRSFPRNGDSRSRSAGRSPSGCCSTACTPPSG